MIIKSISYKHQKPTVLFEKVVHYIFSDKGRADERSSWSFFHNLSAFQPKEIINEFVSNAKLKKARKGGVLAYHYVLSFHEDDSKQLTPEIMQDLVEKFLELRKEKGIAFSRIHNAEKHPHIHILISANEFGSSKSTRKSRNEFLDIHKQLEIYQIKKYPQLQSLVKIRRKNREKSKEKGLSESEKKMKKRLGKAPTKKEQMKSQLIGFIDQTKSIQEFYNLLEQHGFELYFQRKKIRGFLKNGIKFRFTTLGISNEMIRNLMTERERRLADLQDKSNTPHLSRER